MDMARSDWIWYALAAAVGMLAAVVALHSTDLQFAVAFLVVQCTVFGYARPDRPWRWACLIAVCIPLSLLLNVIVTLPSPRELGTPERLFLGPLVVFFRSPAPVSASEIPGSFLAFLPAAIGAYLGAWMSRLTASA